MASRITGGRHAAVAAMVLLAAVGCAREEASRAPEAGSPEPRPAAAKVDLPEDASPPRAAEATSLSIATYNINWGNARMDEVVRGIRQADAGVVCLQETNAESARVLRREFGGRYAEIRFYGSVHPYRAGGFGILSSFPVVKERFIPAEHGLFGAPIVEIRVGGETIQIANVHLQPILLPQPQGPAGLLSVMAAFEEAEETHRKEMSHVLSHLRTDVPTIIVGDFNSCSSFQAPLLLKERGFADSFAAVHDEPEEHPTWQWRTRYGKAALRIDYIFHSPDFRTAESRVVPTDGSDHFLVASRLTEN